MIWCAKNIPIKANTMICSAEDILIEANTLIWCTKNILIEANTMICCAESILIDKNTLYQFTNKFINLKIYKNDLQLEICQQPIYLGHR